MHIVSDCYITQPSHFTLPHTTTDTHIPHHPTNTTPIYLYAAYLHKDETKAQRHKDQPHDALSQREVALPHRTLLLEDNVVKEARQDVGHSSGASSADQS